MRCQLIAELATGHGGDLQLAKDMISSAAENGADIVKTQAYQITHLRPSDPQYDWFNQCELKPEDHQALMAHAKACGVEYLTTAFHVEDLELVKNLGCFAVKIGSGEGSTALVDVALVHFLTVFASLAWGRIPEWRKYRTEERPIIWFSTVPLYPMPIECYAAVERQDGWSDHAVGIDVAKMAIAQGAKYVEKHFQLPGRGRQQSHNMEPQDLKELRRWAEVCAQALDGSKFEGRWTA